MDRRQAEAANLDAREAADDRPAGRPVFIGGEIYRRSSYGAKHPLAIPRMSTVTDLCRALGWLPDDVYVESPMATPVQLRRFHTGDYVAAVESSERDQSVSPERRARYGLGEPGNPVFREMFKRPATAAGGSIKAAELLLGVGGPATVFSPAGGTHHGRPDRASGFCYFNDPVLGILSLLDGGVERVFYADFDAHHGDGVEDAFAGDDRVFTLSVHEAGRWPRTGGREAQGVAVCNLPVPPGFHDDEMAYLLGAVVLPLARRFEAEAIVIQCGADGLADDPLSRLALSNNGLWQAVGALRDMAPRLLVLGGGGYNPWSVGRCWTGVWAVLNDHDVPRELPPAGRAVLEKLTWRRAAGRNPPAHWFTTLADPVTVLTCPPKTGPSERRVCSSSVRWSKENRRCANHGLRKNRLSGSFRNMRRVRRSRIYAVGMACPMPLSTSGRRSMAVCRSVRSSG